MLSADAMAFMKRLGDAYKETGVNCFDSHHYMDIPNHSAIIEELMNAGYLSWKDERQNILGSVVVNFDAFEGEN